MPATSPSPPAPATSTDLRDTLNTLPTPLAQAARRVLNARPGAEHHLAAFYLLEASLKLATSVRIAVLLERPDDVDAAFLTKLEALVLPSIGHWTSFLSESTRILASRADGMLLKQASKGLLRPLGASSATAAFIEAAREAELVSDDAAKRTKKSGVVGFYEALATYRNQVVGHGALRTASFYERFATLLRRSFAEVVTDSSYLGEAKLVVPWLDEDPERGKVAKWKVLHGLAGLTEDADGPSSPSEDSAGRLHVRFESVTLAIHPLVVVVENESGAERFGFLNRAALGKKGDIKRADYLDYSTGEDLKELDARDALKTLLERIRGKKVTSADVDAVAQTIAGAPITPLPAENGASIDESSPEPSKGRVLAGRYEIVRVLGEGGMASVFEARHRELEHRTFAVKILHRELATRADVVERFRREAKEVSALRHPGIVDIVDFGREPDGTVFLVMEKLEGATLDRYVQEQALGIERLVELVAQALEALEVAHARGLVHRDLKPANLFVASSPAGEQTKVLDFGIAKVLGSEGGGTHDGMLLGTPRYMSPEQIRNAAAVDGRSDLYSMGVTLYELLTGIPPVGGETFVEVLNKVSAGEIDRHPRERRPDIPQWLDDIVARSLARDASARFASAKEMRAALLGGIGGKPTPERKQLREVEEAQTVAALPLRSETTVVTNPRTRAPGLWIGVGAGVIGALALLTLALGQHATPATGPTGRASSSAAVSITAPSSMPSAHPERASALPDPAPQGMKWIHGARFQMGSTAEEIASEEGRCDGSEREACVKKLHYETPAHEVDVADFYLDETEVTADAYAGWLNQQSTAFENWGAGESKGKYVMVSGEPFLRLDQTDGTVATSKTTKEPAVAAVEGRGKMPATYVTSLGARKYCEAHGSQLPTEEEWELAARGKERRRFAWGDTSASCTGAAYARMATGEASACRPPGPADVGSTEDRTTDGIRDLGGSVREWTSTPWREHYDGPMVEGEVAIRGGSWMLPERALRAARRGHDVATWADADVGFRCARAARREDPK